MTTAAATRARATGQKGKLVSGTVGFGRFGVRSTYEIRFRAES